MHKSFENWSDPGIFWLAKVACCIYRNIIQYLEKKANKLDLKLSVILIMSMYAVMSLHIKLIK